jgi:hypothetical protein
MGTAIVTEYIDATAGSATIAAIITTLGNTGAGTAPIYCVSQGNCVRFWKYYY